MDALESTQFRLLSMFDLDAARTYTQYVLQPWNLACCESRYWKDHDFITEHKFYGMNITLTVKQSPIDVINIEKLVKTETYVLTSKYENL